MGRPQEHDEKTRSALLAAAEDLLAAEGFDAVSIRRVADQVGTTTRAVYSLFGSKDGLVAALGAKAFELLGHAVAELPVTDDAAADLVAAGVIGFRQLVVTHPNLFRLGVQQLDVNPRQLFVIRGAAATAWRTLQARVDRLGRQGNLGGWSVNEAATAFHALCEGLAALELRGLLGRRDTQEMWRISLTALVHGFGTSPHCREERADRPRNVAEP